MFLTILAKLWQDFGNDFLLSNIYIIIIYQDVMNLYQEILSFPT